MLTLDTGTPSKRCAAIEGILEGAVIDGHACFWITSRTGHEVTIVWPHGHVAELHPLRVETADGRIRATAGTFTRLGGAPAEAAGCRRGSTQFRVRDLDREG